MAKRERDHPEISHAKATLDVARRNGIALGEDEILQLMTYSHLVARWNLNTKLIGPADIEKLWSYHILDSLFYLLHCPQREDLALLDVGSGAGLPGLVLKIARKTWDITLLDSSRRRVSFLRFVIRELGLSRTRAEWGRLEESGEEPEGRVDVVTTRAVCELATLLEGCRAHLKPKGQVVTIKGTRAVQEIETARAIMETIGATATLKAIPPVPSDLPRPKVRRSFVVVRLGEALSE